MRQTDEAWSSRFAAADELGDWLDSMDWHYWATWTFRDKRSARSIRRAVEAHIDRIGASRAFWGIESGKVNGRLHAHGLLYFSRQIPPQAEAIWRDWHQRHGRAHVDKYKDDCGAAHYLSEYVTKDIADYDIQGSAVSV
jgi:hypothetical protein